MKVGGYLNSPQMRVHLVGANETYAVMGRGTGKTTGIAPVWLFDRIQKMPGAPGFILGSTYQQILTRTLPPMIKFWQEQLKLVRGVHFVVNQRPPKNWECEFAEQPERWDNVIAWSNGTLTYLISQDRAGIPNSLSLAYGLVDEAKYIDMQRFYTDLVPAMRGGRHKWGHLSEYSSLLFTTDQPTAPEGQWIWEKEKVMDRERVDAILAIQFYIQKYRNKLTAGGLTEATQEEYGRRISAYMADLNRLRRKLVYYIEASAEENLHVLGQDYIDKQRALLPDFLFDTSILNKRATRVVGGFYPHLSDAAHTYLTFDNSFLSKLEAGTDHVLDCRQDADIDETLPLHIGCDHGARINCLNVGQGNEKHVKILNSMYVLHPQTTADLALQFCKYYEPLKNKRVVFHYDATAKAETGKAKNITYVSELCDVLKSYGWKIDLDYIGRTPLHTDRYNLWANSLRGWPDFPTISMNRYHTQVLRDAMRLTKSKEGTTDNVIKKNKADERKENFPQEKAPHITDAADTLLWGIANRKEARHSGDAYPAAMG